MESKVVLFICRNATHFICTQLLGFTKLAFCSVIGRMGIHLYLHISISMSHCVSSCPFFVYCRLCILHCFFRFFFLAQFATHCPQEIAKLNQKQSQRVDNVDWVTVVAYSKVLFIFQNNISAVVFPAHAPILHSMNIQICEYE